MKIRNAKRFYKYEDIRDQLYSGAMEDIAKATGYTAFTVRDVLKNRRRNKKIFKAALELIRLHREVMALITIKYKRGENFDLDTDLELSENLSESNS
jgi:predicted transcriptional regulator